MAPATNRAVAGESHAGRTVSGHHRRVLELLTPPDDQHVWLVLDTSRASDGPEKSGGARVSRSIQDRFGIALLNHRSIHHDDEAIRKVPRNSNFMRDHDPSHAAVGKISNNSQHLADKLSTANAKIHLREASPDQEW